MIYEIAGDKSIVLKSVLLNLDTASRTLFRSLLVDSTSLRNDGRLHSVSMGKKIGFFKIV